MQNDDFDKELANLWQQQPTLSVDATEVRRRASRMRMKHAFYALLDFGALILGLAILFIARDKFSNVFFWGMLIFIGVVAVFTLYVVYLRRHALLLRVGSDSTQAYLTTLLAQAKNNIKIAIITKHSCWISFLALVGFWLLIGVFDDIPYDTWLRKTLISSALAFVLMVGMWFWASWRERKFRRLVQSLKNQLTQLDTLV